MSTHNPDRRKALRTAAMPKGDQKCGICTHFRSPESCELVEGKISPEGWCMLWAKKA